MVEGKSHWRVEDYERGEIEMKSVQPKREEIEDLLRITLDAAFAENRQINLSATRETIPVPSPDEIERYEATGRMQIVIDVGYVRPE